MKMDPSKIPAFRGEFAFLSNFFPAVVTYQGLTYPTTEHAFQAAKTDNAEWKARIQAAPTPTAAKQLGKQCPARPNWDSGECLKVMEELTTLKFARGSWLAAKLLQIEGPIVERNWWGDTFWGMSGRRGLNWLGHLLEKRRAQLQESEPHSIGLDPPTEENDPIGDAELIEGENHLGKLLMARRTLLKKGG